MALLGEASRRDRPLLLELDHPRKEHTLLQLLDNILLEGLMETKTRAKIHAKVSVTSMIHITTLGMVGIRVIPDPNLPERKCQISICWSKTPKVSSDNSRSRSILSLDCRRPASKDRSNRCNLNRT